MSSLNGSSVFGSDILSGYSVMWAQLPVSLVVIESILIVMAVLGNGWILVAGLRKSQLRNSPFHLLLLNYSSALLLLSIFVYPSLAFRLRRGLARNKFEIKLCQFSSLSLLWWLAVALFTNGFLAVNRAFSCHPLSPVSAAMRSRRTTIFGMIIIWIASFLLYSVPAFLEAESFKDIFMCKSSEQIVSNILSGREPLMLQPWKAIVSYEMSTTVLITLLVNTISYTIIIRYLLKNQGQGSHCSDQRRREKKRALFIIVILFVILLVCIVPLLCALIIDPAIIARQHVYLFLPLVETVLDPVVYLVTMPTFRPEWIHRNRGRRDSFITDVSQTSRRVSVAPVNVLIRKAYDLG